MRMCLRKPTGATLLLVLGVCAWPPVLAQAGAAAPNVAPTGSPADQALDSARDSVRSAAVWLASGVDSWFGDRPFKDGGQVSDGQLAMSIYKRRDQAVDFNLRFNARFKLPNLEHHTYLFTGRDNPREIITDKPGSFSRQQLLQTQTQEDRAFFAGLGRLVSDSVDLRAGFHGALKPYVQARYRKAWEPSPFDAVEFRQTVFLTIADHLGSTTALSYQHTFSPTLVGRWLSAATMTQTDSQLEWNSSVGVYKSLGSQRLASLELLASGKQGTGVAFSDYGVQLRWEQPVHKDWLLGEVVVGRFWPRPDALSERGNAWAAGTGLKMRF